ncbi:MAG TPA: hypothetical protein VMU39_09265 [Solirubrobacteraceae bacterium]|nr:hypothetical protein [Solirubrobacteraceae bacterium]
MKGRSTFIRLKRVVDAATLPAATTGPPTNVEPQESVPVTGPPRIVGVIPLVQKRLQGAPEARASSLTRVSVAGLANSGKLPPDTQLAVSSKRVVEFVNDSAEVLDHAGTVLGSFDLGTLFSGTAGTGSDPKIVFDAASGDFYAAYISKVTSHDGPSEIDLAATNNPQGNWSIYTVHSESILQDQPKLGVSSDKLTISWNDNGNSGPEEYMVIQKAGVAANHSTVAATIWGPDSTRLNLIPADQLSASKTAFAVFHNYNTSKVGVLSFTGVPGISPVSFTESDVSVAKTSAPPSAVQPPSGGSASPTLDTGDDRLESAAWLGGVLWTAGNDVCKFRTDKKKRACLRVIKIATAKMSLVRDVDITMVGGDVMYPAVMLDARKDFWVGFSSSSISQFASSEVAEAPGGTIGSSIGATIYGPGTGSANYLSCTSPPVKRFGDYSGAAIDPARENLGIWTATEFGAAGCAWGTQLGSFTP